MNGKFLKQVSEELEQSNCELKDDVLKCCSCGDTLQSALTEKNLQDHLMTIFGFVEYHKNCKSKKTTT